jgi:hypothetical protein
MIRIKLKELIKMKRLFFLQSLAQESFLISLIKTKVYLSRNNLKQIYRIIIKNFNQINCIYKEYKQMVKEEKKQILTNIWVMYSLIREIQLMIDIFIKEQLIKC